MRVSGATRCVKGPVTVLFTVEQRPLFSSGSNDREPVQILFHDQVKQIAFSFAGLLLPLRPAHWVGHGSASPSHSQTETPAAFELRRAGLNAAHIRIAGLYYPIAVMLDDETPAYRPAQYALYPWNFVAFHGADAYC